MTADLHGADQCIQRTTGVYGAVAAFREGRSITISEYIAGVIERVPHAVVTFGSNWRKVEGAIDYVGPRVDDAGGQLTDDGFPDTVAVAITAVFGGVVVFVVARGPGQDAHQRIVSRPRDRSGTGGEAEARPQDGPDQAPPQTVQGTLQPVHPSEQQEHDHRNR